MKSTYKASLKKSGSIESQLETIECNDISVTLATIVYDGFTTTTNSITMLDKFTSRQCYMSSNELSMLLSAIYKARDNGFTIESISNFISSGLGGKNNE